LQAVGWKAGAAPGCTFFLDVQALDTASEPQVSTKKILRVQVMGNKEGYSCGTRWDTRGLRSG